jgi:hypothetical protein
MGAGVAEGDQKSVAGSEPTADVVTERTPLQSLRLTGLLLLDSAGNDPVRIEAMEVTDEGIGVVRAPGDPPRVLPWASVAAHVVERWGGGAIPAWWVDPELNGRRRATDPPVLGARGTESPERPGRTLPEAEPGAVIAIQTPFGTYRFLLPGGDPIALSNRITDFAVRNQGLSGVPSVTLVARPRRGDDRRQGSRSRPSVSPWHRIRPFLIVALVVVIAAAITLILLQSAGTIHLPYLGGASPGTVIPVGAG